MKLIFWKKGRIVRVRVTDIDELLADLHPDPEVVDLLQQKIHGVSTQVDECHLDERIRKDEKAQEAYEAMKAMYPEKDLKIRCIKRMVKTVCLVLFLLLSGAGLIYAGLHYAGLLHRAPVVHKLSPPPPSRVVHQPTAPPTFKNPDLGNYRARLDSLMDSAEVRYNKTIVLDEAEVVKLHGVASLDSTISFNEFLSNVAATNGLKFHVDPAGVIHIRIATSTDTVKK